MDALPTEIVTHILSFLEGKDLFRSKLLCSRFQTIINRNREVFQYPRFHFTFLNPFMDSKEEFVMHVSTKWGCNVKLSRNDEVLITPFKKEDFRCFYPCFLVEDSEGQMSKFFGDFLKGNGQKPKLQDIFQYIFEKINIDELLVQCHRIPAVFSALNEAIKSSCVSIRDISFTPRGYVGQFQKTPELCDLLTTIANQKTNSKVYPRLKIGDIPYFIKHYWNRFTDFNEIALLFKKCIFEMDCNEAVGAMFFITDEFAKEPISRFNFYLSVRLREEMQFYIRDLEEYCDIEQPDGDFLLRCLNEEEAYVKMTHRQSNMALTFKKRGKNVLNRFLVECACVYIDDFCSE